MTVSRTCAAALLALPLLGQNTALRFEVPFAQGQSLPQTLLTGTSQLASGSLDTGHGGILTYERRFLAWPILRLAGCVEGAQLRTSGTLHLGSGTQEAALTQSGLGLGLNAQFWIPFTGIAGDFGLLQRFHHYRYEAAGASETHDLSRTWLRVGARWRLPLPLLQPTLVASYQEPLRKDRPVKVASASDLANYLQVQGSGQEFQRLWTFGVSVAF